MYNRYSRILIHTPDSLYYWTLYLNSKEATDSLTKFRQIIQYKMLQNYKQNNVSNVV